MLVLDRLLRLRLFGTRDMDCTEVWKLSSEYLDGNLPATRLQRFRAHISNCRPCQSFVESLSSIVGLLAKLTPIQSPPTLKSSIIERIAEGKQGRSKAG